MARTCSRRVGQDLACGPRFEEDGKLRMLPSIEKWREEWHEVLQVFPPESEIALKVNTSGYSAMSVLEEAGYLHCHNLRATNGHSVTIAPTYPSQGARAATHHDVASAPSINIGV